MSCPTCWRYTSKVCNLWNQGYIFSDDKTTAYRIAHQALYPQPSESDSRQIYHSICPFPALSPVPGDGNEHAIQQQADNEAAYRQLLVQGVLAVLLPTEDLENDCLTTLVGQILSEMIIGGALGGKASEPWLLWEAFTKTAELIQTKLPKSKAQDRIDRSNSGLLPVLSKHKWRSKSWNMRRSVQKTFWLVLQYAFLTITTIRYFIITIATSSSLPSRISPTMKITGSGEFLDGTEAPKHMDTKMISHYRIPPLKQPILNMKIWSCVSTLLDVDARMPWLSATLSMLQWGAIKGPGGVGNTDGTIDK
jgi:hypothetical protein